MIMNGDIKLWEINNDEKQLTVDGFVMFEDSSIISKDYAPALTRTQAPPHPISASIELL